MQSIAPDMEVVSADSKVMIATGGQIARPYNCVHVQVFTDVYTLLLIQSFTRFANYVHPLAASPAKDPIVPPTAFSISSHDECHGQKQKESRILGCIVTKCRAL